VLAGDADAGAVKHEVLALDAYRGLRSIAETPRISEHLFVTRADLPPMRVEAIRQALLGLDDPRVLTPLNAGTTGLVPVADADYDPLRRILQALGTDGPAP
jgi:phosphonate transport system substrate-binding protein